MSPRKLRSSVEEGNAMAAPRRWPAVAGVARPCSPCGFQPPRGGGGPLSRRQRRPPLSKEGSFELRFLALGLALILLPVAPLQGHDIETLTEVVPPAVIIRAVYGGNDPVAKVSALVFGPEDRKVEFQNGRTDARGVFSFVPDRQGEWLVVLDDELGHRNEVRVNIDDVAVFRKTRLPSSLWQKLLTGVSLILGFTGMFLWHKARKLLQRGRLA